MVFCIESWACWCFFQFLCEGKSTRGVPAGTFGFGGPGVPGKCRHAEQFLALRHTLFGGRGPGLGVQTVVRNDPRSYFPSRAAGMARDGPGTRPSPPMPLQPGPLPPGRPGPPPLLPARAAMPLGCLEVDKGGKEQVEGLNFHRLPRGHRRWGTAFSNVRCRPRGGRSWSRSHWLAASGASMLPHTSALITGRALGPGSAHPGHHHMPAARAADCACVLPSRQGRLRPSSRPRGQATACCPPPLITGPRSAKSIQSGAFACQLASALGLCAQCPFIVPSGTGAPCIPLCGPQVGGFRAPAWSPCRIAAAVRPEFSRFRPPPLVGRWLHRQSTGAINGTS